MYFNMLRAVMQQGREDILPPQAVPSCGSDDFLNVKELKLN
jgi:hypothetical protein